MRERLVRSASAKRTTIRMAVTLPERALIVDEPWLELILAGDKDWEMRSRRTSVRGTVGLIRKGSGLVVGSVEIIDSLPACSLEDMLAYQARHRIPAGRLHELASWRHPWVMRNPLRWAKPVPYRHPQGAVVWVRLEQA